MKILIYGINSYIARKFIYNIRKDVSITILVDSKNAKKHLKEILKQRREIEILETHLLNSFILYEKIKGISLIYFFLPHILYKNEKQISNTKEYLIDGLKNLLFFAKREGVKAIVYSGALYPTPKPYELFPKDSLYSDHFYEIIKNHEKEIISSGLHYAIFKPIFVFDEDYFFSFFKKIRILFLPKWETKIKPIHISDYIKALKKAPSLLYPTSIIYEIIGCKEISIKELFKPLIQKKTIKKIFLDRNNFFSTIGKLGKFFYLPFSKKHIEFILSNPSIKNWEVWYEDFDIECENVAKLPEF